MPTNKANEPKKEKPGRKILERIKKLLAMSKDAGSPNEAAIAARRAERMMAEYNLEHADILTAGLDLDSIDQSLHGKSYKSFPKHLSMLAAGVSKYTGCHARFGREPGTVKRQIVFLGEKSDLEICKYLWTYLAETTDRLCKASGVKHIGPRTAFKKGCVHEICNTLERMRAEDQASDAQVSDGKSLILVDKKQSLIAQKFGVTKYTQSQTKFRSNNAFDAFEAGQEAGRRVSIHKAVNTSAGAKRLT